MRFVLLVLTLSALSFGQNPAAPAPAAPKREFPYLPGSKWRLHDPSRPLPTRVNPGTESSQEKPGRAPSDAIVLFDGANLDQWVTITKGVAGPAKWKVENGYMEVVPGAGSLESKLKFGTAQYHVEWAAPDEIKGSDQGRGNSGFYLMHEYEVQVLDNWDNKTYADGWAGAIYNHQPPLVDACRKPGEWQTYDIVFEAPVFEGDKLVKPPYVTVIYNGVVIHNHLRINGRYNTGGTYLVQGKEAPILLQNHSGDRVRFRNIWVRPLKDYDE
jgi:hypothetical protein